MFTAAPAVAKRKEKAKAKAAKAEEVDTKVTKTKKEKKDKPGAIAASEENAAPSSANKRKAGSEVSKLHEIATEQPPTKPNPPSRGRGRGRGGGLAPKEKKTG